jgi:hypothetical protein
MASRPPVPLCCSQLGTAWVDDGTKCLTRCTPPATTGTSNTSGSAPSVPSDPSFLEQLRQSAIIASIIGVRKGIAQLNVMNPLGIQAVTNDEVNANALLAQGDYDRAFEVATGFADYFELHRQGKKNNSPGKEVAAVMLGHATGFNQAVETFKAETATGDKLEGLARFEKGLDALMRIASTALTIEAGVQSVGSLYRPLRIVSPIYRIGQHDVAIVETSLGRQAFYRSTGVNSGQPGKWFPVDEFHPWNGYLNKMEYTQRPGLEKGQPLHRLGNEEFARISEQMGRQSIPRGAEVPGGLNGEPAETTLNRILDFFGARTPDGMFVRPVKE